MNAAELTPLIGSVSSLLLLLAGGIKWAVARADDRIAKSEARLQAQIDDLRAQLDRSLKREKVLLRRVFSLEADLRSNGLSPTPTDGWPFAEDD